MIGIRLQNFEFVLTYPSSRQEITGLPWVRLNEQHQGLPSERWNGAEKATCRSRIATDSYLSVMQLISAGNGIGLVPDFVVRSNPLLGSQKTETSLPQWSLWLLYQPQLRKSPLARTFSDYLKENWLPPVKAISRAANSIE
ncbi:LysR substrate-binding domain-containing protein [Veronia nyctiphanis]|uniref:LysR substrate-binding domain-containing protein n=1 Tax=Veronia nyctiphanis TaxID=1278244 RepID=UPI001F3804DC|nr:LysR substrate-binding domain-containing protein [Veronia nyctiphanis]